MGEDRIRHPATVSTFKRASDRISAGLGAYDDGFPLSRR
jgi:hypothetical protein